MNISSYLRHTVSEILITNDTSPEITPLAAETLYSYPVYISNVPWTWDRRHS